MAVTFQQLNELYLAYFGRPVDYNGYIFYTSNPNETVATVSAAFSASPESQALYGTGNIPAMVNAIYQNLFNRDAEPAGLTYWSTQISAGIISAPEAALVILHAAVGTDATAVANKLAIAQDFFDALDTSAELLGYSGTQAAQEARDYIATVGYTPESLAAAQAALDATVAAVTESGTVPVGQTLTLTAGVDNLTLTGPQADTVTGVVDGTNGTFSIGDNVHGNGHTNVNLVVASVGSEPFTTLVDVGAVNITAGVSGSLDLNATNWSGIGAVNLMSGADNLRVNVAGLNAGADLSVSASVAGSVSASFTNDVGAWMWSDRGSSISLVDGNVTGAVDAGGSASFSMWASADNTAVTVGNISITAAGNDGSDAWVRVSNTQDKAGDVTVGNVTMTGFTSSVTLDVQSTGHTADSPASNVTVGNVTMTGVGGASVTLDVSNTGSGEVGNLTIGNVALTTGKNGSIDMSVTNSGDVNVGNLAVGSINLVGGVNSSVSMTIDNYVFASGTDNATLGTTTVGSIALALGMSATAESIDITAEAYNSGTGKATVGAVSIGTFAADLAQNASVSLSISVSAYSSGGAASVGNVSIGAASFTMAVDASADVSVSIEADAGGTAAGTVGDVALGGVSVTSGINTSFSASYDVNAYGSTKSAIGNVTTGTVTLNGDDGANLNYDLSISSDGKIGNVSIGNAAVTLGVSASATFDNYIYADTSVGNLTVGNVTVTGGVNSNFSGSVSATANAGDMGAISIGNLTMNIAKSGWASMTYEASASNDIGNISVGNVTLTAAQGAYAYASHSFSAWSGDVGNVTVGNLSLTAGKNATADYYFSVEGETSIGTVTFGNATLAANADGANATATFSVSNDASGTIGAVTVGNVSVSAAGAGALAHYSIAVSSADSAGTLTIGNVSLTTGNAASKTGAMASVDIDNELGAVVVGDITLTANGVRDGSTTDLRTYDADLAITADTTITVGNITVSGGDGKADNFGVVTNWLSMTSNTAAKITIGGVDYSGYGAAATLDAHLVSGAAFIKGTAKADTITDNKGTNALTGNGGADKFVFVTNNANLTAATADSITDFSNSGGDKIVIGIASAASLNVVNYGEASYTDFASFVTGANAANKEVFVGQIGGDSYVAVDSANDGTVDFMVKLTGVSLSQVDVASFLVAVG